MPAIFPKGDDYISFTVKNGYIMYRWKRPGFCPDPRGSLPLLGKAWSNVIADFRRSIGHVGEYEVDHEK